jgi:hypothetical protein
MESTEGEDPNDGLSQEKPLDDLAERYEKVRVSPQHFKYLNYT